MQFDIQKIMKMWRINLKFIFKFTRLYKWLQNNLWTYRCTKTSQKRCETFRIRDLFPVCNFFFSSDPQYVISFRYSAWKCWIFYTVGLTLEVSRAHGRAVMKQQFTDDHFRWVGHTIIEWAQPFQILVIGTCSQIQQSLEAWNWIKM